MSALCTLITPNVQRIFAYLGTLPLVSQVLPVRFTQLLYFDRVGVEVGRNARLGSTFLCAQVPLLSSVSVC
jgi:hypothetical protein